MEQKILIEDNSGDRKYFTLVPNFILNHSSATDQAVYLQMKRLTDETNKNICYPSFRYLKKQLRIGETTLKKSIKYLIEHKWIEDSGKKRIKTKGGYQWTQTYKINDIWKLNIEYYQGVSNQGHPEINKVSPESNKVSPIEVKVSPASLAKEEPLKKELIKEEHIDNSFKNINYLLDLFKGVNPSYKRLFLNRTQRAAITRVLKSIGEEKLVFILNALPKSNSEKYAPTITTPLQLEEKLGQLISFWQKKKNNNQIAIL